MSACSTLIPKYLGLKHRIHELEVLLSRFQESGSNQDRVRFLEACELTDKALADYEGMDTRVTYRGRSIHAIDALALECLDEAIINPHGYAEYTLDQHGYIKSLRLTENVAIMETQGLKTLKYLSHLKHFMCLGKIVDLPFELPNTLKTLIIDDKFFGELPDELPDSLQIIKLNGSHLSERSRNILSAFQLRNPAARVHLSE